MTTPSQPARPAPVNLFYSYAHEDEALRDELQDHLMILERRGVVRSWHDRAIVPGHEWDRDIDEHLGAADLVLLLISKDFIASDYIMGAELRLAMERQARGDAVVVPILLRPVDLQPEDAADLPFVGLLSVQGLPKDLKPVTSWPNRDEAWTNVAGGLRATVKEIQGRRRRASAVPAAAAPMPGPEPPPAAAPMAAPRPAPGGGIAESENLLLARVVGQFSDRVREATLQKGGDAPDPAVAARQARGLIDLVEPKRILWVDDNPENNSRETAALAKLQIEVVAVRSTADAIARLSAPDAGGFDLVVSDWTRRAEGPLAGLQLLRELRRHGHQQPVVFYHGTSTHVARAALRASARAAGAFGEAVQPAELMQLVLDALSR